MTVWAEEPQILWSAVGEVAVDVIDMQDKRLGHPYRVDAAARAAVWHTSLQHRTAQPMRLHARLVSWANRQDLGGALSPL